MFPSTKTQRQLIGIACGQLGIDKPMKEDMLRERFGKESTTLISRAQADEFLKELKSRGFETRYTPRSKPRGQHIPRAGGKVTAMVSQQELEKIAAVSALIPWRLENGLALWMKKRVGVDKIRTAEHAYKVIEGLKKMFENGMKKQHGPDWWVMIHPGRPDIETYIQEHCPLDYRLSMLARRLSAGMITPEYYNIKVGLMMRR
ncbi:MAG: DUF1018 domain-containing protein [Desulfobacteraceae bacterium]|nr:DUF1018 domain-containing protein [Desulfobacteraceae bacterium]